MTETFSGRIDGMDAEQYSMKRFEEMAQQAREAENKRVETGVTVGSLGLEFTVAYWLTDREGVLASLGVVLDEMLEVDGRTTGTFKIVVELPDIAGDRAPDGGRCN